jgi:hypothetical protein
MDGIRRTAFLVTLLAAGCRGEPTATPRPTLGPATLAALPPATPSATFVPLVATPRPAATALPGPTLLPIPGGAEGAGVPAVPEPGCELVVGTETWSLAPADDAPAGERAVWLSGDTPVLEAIVVEPAGLGAYILQPLAPAAPYSFTLGYSGDPPPVVAGQSYHFQAHAEDELGSGLLIEDEDGVLFLGVSLREAEGADAAILGGERFGFAVHQEPTECLYTELDPCGYELRAAPAVVARGQDSVTLDAGAQGLLPGDPPFTVTVHSSHFRRWLGDLPCPDSSDWVLSYRIERGG